MAKQVKLDIPVLPGCEVDMENSKIVFRKESDPISYQTITIEVPDGYEIDKGKSKIAFKRIPHLITLDEFKNMFDYDIFLNGYDHLGIGLNGLKKLPKLSELYDDVKAEETGDSAREDELVRLIQDFNDLIDDKVKYSPEVKEILKEWYKDLLGLITRCSQESGLGEDEKRCLEGWKKRLKDPDKYLK